MTMHASVSGMNETHYIFMSSSTNSFGTLFVEVMDLFKCLLFVSILNYVSTEPSHSDQHEDAFHSILETLKLNDTLRLQDVNVILTKLGIHDCSNATKHKCITAESLFKIFNISTITSDKEEAEFSKFAPIIVYALLPNEQHSQEHTGDGDHDEHDNEKQITQNVDVYKEFLERYETGVLCEQIFDQLLKEVNSTTGQLLHAGNECFSSDDIFHQLNISSGADIGKSLLPEISVSIISRLLQAQCIEVRYQSPLPCSSHFVNQLFQEYADNGVISEEKIEKLLKKLKIGRDDEGHPDDHDNDHDDHDHRRRRSLTIPEDPLQSQIQGTPHSLQRRYRRQTTDHDHGNETKKYQKCYSVDELFAIYQVDKMTGFKLEKFQSLSSALLQQIESEACAAESHDDHSSNNDVAAKHKWGYSILAVAVISLLSIIGVAIIPFMNKIFYKITLVFFIALAIGTLAGDALLHLFPHALGFHASHDHAHDSGSSDESEERDHLWKFLVATAAIYGFFLFETVTHLFLGKSGHSHSVEHTVTEECAVESGDQNRNEPHDLTNMAYMNNEDSENQRYDNDTTTTTNKEKPAVFENGCDGISPEKSSAIKKKSISSVAWNIIVGDTMHNIADGIAIGIAFSDSISGGLSTSIAVFCHELPHELGDFAVLLSAGMSVKKALLANFFTACSCFIGLVFGILISEIEDVNLWIFAATGGFFIYIALTNMLPTLMHSPDFRDLPKLSKFLLQNLGMLTGFGIMFLLSYYEEDINV